MFGKKVSEPISGTDRKNEIQIPDLIHSRDSLQRILEVERMRSDRSDCSFCLVSFNQSHHRQTAEAINILLNVIQKSIRATDHAGFLGRFEVGVVLWNTTPQGAQQFVLKILKDFPEALSPEMVIYTYPDDGKNPCVPEIQDELTNTVTQKSEDGPVENAIKCLSVQVPDPLTVIEPRQVTMTTSDNTVAQVEPAPDSPGILTDSLTTPPHQILVQPLSQLYVKGTPFWKRCLDLLGASTGLLLLFPILIISGLAVKFSSKGQILFYQDRTGLGGRKFKMIKFRTMVIDAEAKKQALIFLNEQDGPAFKINKDPRITSVGHFLRAFSIDELPQLWNVIKGDMTLVGPRPLPCSESEGCYGWQRRRLDVTPGLTCFWQIKDRRNKIPFADWVRMDLQYIGCRTIKQDLSLILQTVRTILSRKGI